MSRLKPLPFLHSNIFLQFSRVLFKPGLYNSGLLGVTLAFKKLYYESFCYQILFNLIDDYADMLSYLLQRLVYMRFYRSGRNRQCCRYLSV